MGNRPASPSAHRGLPDARCKSTSCAASCTRPLVVIALETPGWSRMLWRGPECCAVATLAVQVSSCRCVADAHGAGGGDIEAEVDEQAEAVASAALAALSRAKVRPGNKPAKQPSPRKQQQQAASIQQDTDADDEPDQQAAAKQKQRRQKSPGAGRKRKATSADSDSSSTYSDLDGSGSDTDRGSEQALTVSYASSTAASDGDDSGSSGSADGSDSDAEEASQPCWGAAAGAQQLLEPGLAWAGGACASAALEQVPKPAILAAVGELVLRVEEEQRRQAAARQLGVQQVGSDRWGVGGQWRTHRGFRTIRCIIDCQVWLLGVVGGQLHKYSSMTGSARWVATAGGRLKALLWRCTLHVCVWRTQLHADAAQQRKQQVH